MLHVYEDINIFIYNYIFLPPGLTSVKHTCFEIAMKDLTNLPRVLLLQKDPLLFNSPVQETEQNDEIITFVTPTSIITHMY